MSLINLAERRLVPDAAIRFGIRRLLDQRIRIESSSSASRESELQEFAADLRRSPLAVETAAANEQHYEVPAEFFRFVLGSRLKYSCCLFPSPTSDLDTAEREMLGLTCDRAQIEDGMDILELGCGWGSLTLWMAENYPRAQVTAISNSHSQREFIEARCREQGLSNVRVITTDMREFDIDEQFDRVVSVEMFEHMRNYELLMQRISGWLRPSGKLMVHIFCHQRLAYLFETEGANNWMGRHFFTGGMMPSEDLLLHFQDHLSVDDQWQVNGQHYYWTCEAWLKRLDANRDAIIRLFEQHFDRKAAARQVQRWRIFFMACAELFRYRGGSEWFVAHYLFNNRSTSSARQSSTGQVSEVV